VLNLKLSFTNDEVLILKVVLGIQSMVMSSDLVKNALVIAIYMHLVMVWEYDRKGCTVAF